VSSEANRVDQKGADKRRRLVKVLVALSVLVFDFVVFVWLVPIAEREIVTDYGSGGYLLAFAMALWTVMAFAILVAAPKSYMSYPTDHLK
jgi:hypothetical protein